MKKSKKKRIYRRNICPSCRELYYTEDYELQWCGWCTWDSHLNRFCKKDQLAGSVGHRVQKSYKTFTLKREQL